MTVVHAFDPPERFVAGTVGPPGQRTFFLQARSGNRTVSVALEKQFVSALATRVDELLDNLMGTDDDVMIPAVAPLALVDDAPLDAPIEEAFRAAAMTLSWDGEASRLVIEVLPSVPDDDEDDVSNSAADASVPDEMLVVRLTPAGARAFAARAARVVDAGRPTCPFCTEPIDPDGHLCVRANGFRRRPL